MKAAHDIEGLAKRVVPVDTGNLKNSIQVAEDGDLAATIGPRGVEYDYYVEMGTRRMGARPYMRPAAEHVRPSFITAMEQIIG
jgi:HK97 gp10 family phage protein